MKNLRTLVLLSLASLFISVSGYGEHKQNSAKPNIILILIDDQDMDEIATYGGKVYTPNLDRIAAEGIRFNRAFVSSTVCTPSRYTFLTGRYAGNSYSNVYYEEVPPGQQGFPGFNVALENDRMNVAKVLSDAGYITGFTGKYHLMSAVDQPELYEGEDTFISGFSEGNKKQAKPGPEISGIFAHNEKWGRQYLKYMGFDWAKNIYEGNLAQPYAAHNPEWNAAAVIEFLNEFKDQAFFIQCCPTLLHGPDAQWVNSFDYPDYTGAGEIKAPASVMEKRIALRNRLKELGYDPRSGDWGIAWIDAIVGDILDELDALDIADNTLIIFAPDHGSNDKASLFGVDGVQIPLVMRWPNGITAGIESDELVQNIDMAPTYFELAGCTVPENYKLDGKSLVPLFNNGTTNEWRDHLYFELGNARAVMKGEWKYIAMRYPKEEIRKIKTASYDDLPKLMSPLQRLGIGIRGASHPGFWDEDQLYNLSEDPLEMKNLAYDPEYQDELQAMKRLLTEELQKLGRPFGEFVNTGNAGLNGQIQEQINIVKQINVQGKNIVVPENISRPGEL